MDSYSFRTRLVKTLGGEEKESLNRVDSYNILHSSKLEKCIKFIRSEMTEPREVISDFYDFKFRSDDLVVAIKIERGRIKIISYNNYN